AELALGRQAVARLQALAEDRLQQQLGDLVGEPRLAVHPREHRFLRLGHRPASLRPRADPTAYQFRCLGGALRQLEGAGTTGLPHPPRECKSERVIRIVVTGGRGFVGRSLAGRLSERGALLGEPIEELVVFDLPDDDVGDPEQLRRVLGEGAGVVFHLASILSGEGEVSFDGALHVNLDGTRNVLEACRGLGTRPRVVFASTIGTFGPPAMTETVSDATKQTPQTTYGTTKAMCEL